MNKERNKLDDPRKCDFYVREHLYLSTKWALRDIDFSKIRLKRAESHEWDHSFFDYSA